MNQTRPRVFAPISDRPTDDLIEAWRQPEARDLWERVLSPHVARRDGVPALHFTLGVMLATAGLRSTPHIRHAHDQLLNNAKLFDLVSELALGCQGVLQAAPSVKSYPQVTRLLPRLSEGLAAEAQITLAEIASAFTRAGIPVGRFLAVDGSLVPAWAPQRSGKVNGKLDPRVEARLRRRTPEAGFRAYSRHHLDGPDSNGNRTAGNQRTQSFSRTVRGYSLTVLVDILTGLPLVLDLRDAVAAPESRILQETLLPRLFDISPGLGVEAIVGDGAYDNNPIHEHLETHYGIHLVAARGDDAFQRRGRVFKPGDHPSVAFVRGDGIAVCRAHGLELKYLKLDAPARTKLGLPPGEPTKPASFRSRFECPAGCGNVSVPTRECWSSVPFFPHTPNGRPALYATRRALLGRRNQVEACFSSLQVGYKQGLDGAVRSRLFERTSNEALIALAMVTRALLTLHAERTRPRGVLT